MYFVSRQHYWGMDPEEAFRVEVVSGGSDHAGPDMLNPRYPGEGWEYEDPREAVETAIKILAVWQQEEPRATLGVGHTLGGSLPLEPCTVEEARRWAEEIVASWPRCDRCGQPFPEQAGWRLVEGEGLFCSEYCAEEAYRDLLISQEEMEV